MPIDIKSIVHEEKYELPPEALAGRSSIRNKVIARVFEKAGIIEGWGTGLSRIIEKCPEYGVEPSEFIEIGDMLRVQFYRPSDKEYTKRQATEQVTEQVKRLLACLGDKSLSTKEILAALGLKHRPTLLSDYLQPALKGGFIQMTQPSTPRSPAQKYRRIKTVED